MALQIAIDGHSSCGKSTLAKDIGKALNILYIDSGAMYRAVSLYFIQNVIDYNDETQVAAALKAIDIHFEDDNGRQTILNGKNVELEIRRKAVSDIVSPVSTIAAIREHLVALQQQISFNQHVVMDGRDIGTVVFPNAPVKFFVTASIEVRVERRYQELIDRGVPQSRTEVQTNLLSRDHIDSTRVISPLKQADDAIMIDNSFLNREEQLQFALDKIALKTGWNISVE